MILNDDGPLLLLLCTKRKPGEKQNDIQFVTQVQNRPRTNKINNMLGILVVSAQDSCHIQRCNQSRQDKSESRKQKKVKSTSALYAFKNTRSLQNMCRTARPCTSKTKHIQRFKQDKPESSKQKGKECICSTCIQNIHTVCKTCAE